MTITKRRTNLEKGTVLMHNGIGYIQLISEYNDINGGYPYVKMSVDDNGDFIETERTGFITASDLVGDEVC